MMRSFAGALVVILGSSGVMTAYAEADLERGKQFFQVCVACHGAKGEGNPILNAPASGGQNVWYVMRQLKNFRNGIRGSDPKDLYGIQMRPMAMTLPDDQAIADVAAYIGTLEEPTLAKTVEGNVEAGKKAYVTCVPCHGENGEGAVSLNAPRLSKQYDWYVVRQLNNFKSGVRGAHRKDIYGSQMRPMAQILATDEQVNDVAAYINTLE
jgi:cytochrome c oxidase subunit II